MRVRSKKKQSKFQVVSAGSSVVAPRIIQWVTLTGGERLVAQRKAKRIYASGSRTCIGFQIFAEGERPVREREPEMKMPPTLKPLSTTFSKMEVQVLSRFASEQSRTARTRKEWREKGYKFNPDAIDLIEATDEKQRVYQSTH